MTRYGFAIVILLIAHSPSLYAQSESTLRGTIVAQADGSPVGGAAVRLEGVNMNQTTTDEDGAFSLSRLVPGTYAIVVSRDGFAEARRAVTLKPRQSATIRLELTLRGPNESVQVSTTPETLAETFSPSSTVLQQSTLDDIPLDRKNNFTDLMAMTAPGMVRSHDDFVHVRGNEISLNTFINGVSFWENPHSALSSGLAPDIIQSANVMTGGFPAEYGNRFGGVVDVVTKSGLSRNNEGSLTLGVGTALRHNVAVEYGGHAHNLGYYAYAAGFESARFISPNDPRSIHDTGRGVHNFLQLDFSASPRDLFKVIAMGDGTNFEIPKTPVDDEFRPNLKPYQRTRGKSVIFTWSHAASANTLLSSSLYQRWSDMSLEQTNEPLATVALNDRSLSTTGIKSDLTKFMGRHVLKAGVDVVRLHPDEDLYFYGEGYIAFSHLMGLPHVHLRGPNRGPIAFSGHKTGAEGSLYVQDSVQWTPSVTTNVGLRFDRYSLAMSDSHFSPRASLAYRLNEAGTTLHASYDHFFVPPAIENVLISSAGLTRFLQDFGEERPPLQPIVENQVELGVTHPFSRRLRVGATGYYRQSDNPVHTVLFPDSRVYAYANFDKGKAYGLEIKTEVPVIDSIGVSGYLNYALSRVYFWNPVTAGFVDETHHLEEEERFLAPMDQTHSFNGGIRYTNRRRGFWAAIGFEYGSGTPTEAEDEEITAPLRVPGHFTQDLSVGIDPFRHQDRPRLSLQFNIENLTNNVYRVSQESTFSPGEYYNPRLFSGSMKLNF